MQRFPQARRQRLTRFATALGLAFVSISASAGLVYTYTSPAFASLPAPLAADDRLVFTFESATALPPNFWDPLPTPTRWRFSLGSYAIDSLEAGAALTSGTTIYTDAAGDPMVFCGGASTPNQRFDVNSGQSIGAMLIGTRCSNQNELYQAFAITNGVSVRSNGWGSWSVREGTLDAGPGNTVPEPATWLLSAVALLALARARKASAAA